MKLFQEIARQKFTCIYILFTSRLLLLLLFVRTFGYTKTKVAVVSVSM